MAERTAHAEIRELSEALMETSDEIVENLFHLLKTGTGGRNIKAIKRVEYAITLRENEIEERCMTFLALEHPVAVDLRHIIAIIKINEELGRISDLMLHILERMDQINRELFDSFEFRTIGVDTVRMLKTAMDAYGSRDLALTAKLFSFEERVHLGLRNVFSIVTSLMTSTTIDPDQLLSTLSLARQIGLITEHIISIACAVDYLVKGEVTICDGRHYSRLFNKSFPCNN
jgi:phosphate transport system protein